MTEATLIHWSKIEKGIMEQAKSANINGDLLYDFKTRIYKMATEILEPDEFEPSEFWELLVKCFFIAYPHQSDLPEDLRKEKFISTYEGKTRPHALKEFLLSLNLKPNQRYRLLDTLVVFIEEAEKKDKDFACSRIFVETELKRAKQEDVISPFDYSGLDKYFFPDKIQAFKQIEIEMFKKDFFVNNEWGKKHPKYELAGLIHILHDKQYFKKQLQGKSVSTSLLEYRRFFEQRYNIKIAKEFQPQRIKGKLKLAEGAFQFIIPELKTS